MSTDQSLWFLENIDVIGIFCPKKVDRGDMDEHPHRSVKKGEYIYLPEEHSNRIYFLTSGRVKIGTYGEGGKEITKAILSEGEIFGELSLVGETTRRDFAYAMEDSEFCALSTDEMQSLMRERSALNIFLMRVMGSRMLSMERRLESLVFKDSRTRIIEFVYELAVQKGQRVGYEMLIRKFMTHQEVANLTATSRQTVTTVLNDLRNKNLLTFNRRRLLIRDMDALKAEINTSTSS